MSADVGKICPDMRNIRVTQVGKEFPDYRLAIAGCDYRIDAADAQAKYDMGRKKVAELGVSQGIIFAVAHDLLRARGAQHRCSHRGPVHVLKDLKSLYAVDASDLRL